MITRQGLQEVSFAQIHKIQVSEEKHSLSEIRNKNRAVSLAHFDRKNSTISTALGGQPLTWNSQPDAQLPTPILSHVLPRKP